MSWVSNSMTWVTCNDPDHRGERLHMLETAYHWSARQALIHDGWGYNHANQVHICPICVRRNVRKN